MSVEPLVSIALCTYNGETYISSQLDTIINQTYGNIEIIVVDDGSTDNTLPILKHYEETGKIKLYRNNTNLGFIKNFEKAISLCTGDYIALSDQDDLWELNKIELLVNTIGENMLIFSDSEFIDREGKSLGKVKSQFHNFVKGDISIAVIFDTCVPGHAMLFKKELLNYLFPFPSDLFHDWWVTYTAAALGRITYVKDILVKYRQHPASYTDALGTKKAVKDIGKGRDKIAASTDARRQAIRTKIHHLKTFYHNRANNKKQKRFIANLIVAYRQQENSYIAARLMLIFLLYGNRLFAIQKRSKLKMYAKEIFGIKLKVGFHNYMSRLRGSSQK